MYIICWLNFCILFPGKSGWKIFLRACHYPGKHSCGEPITAALLGAGKGRCWENESRGWMCFQFWKLKAAQLEAHCSVIKVIWPLSWKGNSKGYFIKTITTALFHSTFCFHADHLDTVEYRLFFYPYSQVLLKWVDLGEEKKWEGV